MKSRNWKQHYFYLALVGVIGLGAVLAPSAGAQVKYGSVRGRITDPSGAVVADASVTLTNVGTQIARETRTNGTGEYVFASVDPGTYTETVKAKNYATTERKGVVVDLEQTATVDEVLALGSVGQTVEVSGEISTIDTATASGGQIVTEEQIENLPNQGRNPFTVNKLDNNVTPVGDPRFVRYEDQNGTDSQSVSGAPIGANAYVVDGIPISTSTGGVTFVPAIEAVESVKVQANTYDAELGRTGGGVFNTSLKSGTDKYHGELFGLTRQNALAANAWFNDYSGLPKPDYTTYQYAGAFGGPLPFGDRNRFLKKTFIWATEAGYRQAQPLISSTQYWVPSLAERQGNFSADTVNGNAVTLYDPTSPFVAGSRTTALLGDTIPQGYINPIGQSIVNTFPKPTSSIAYNGTANYASSDDFKTRGDEYVGKLDHEFAEWWNASASYVHLATQEPGGDLYHVFAASDSVLTRYIDASAFNNVFIINPTTLITAGYGYSRYYSTSPQYSNGFNQNTGFGGAGFPLGYVDQLQSKTFPTITLSGVASGASLGAANSGPTIKSQHSLVTVLTKTAGKQTVKVGYVFRLFNQFASVETTGNGSFSFNGQYTSSNGAAPTSGPQAIADLLLGLPSSASVQINAVALNQTTDYQALYVQDDVRLLPKLTANFGIRYEHEPGQRESSNRYNVGFDPNVSYSFAGASGNVAAKGAIAFAGLNGYPVESGSLSHTKFSPRAGLSYQIREDTVIRGGFGVFYAAVPLSAASTGFSQLTSYSPGSATGPVAAGPNAWFSNPFGSQLLAPTGTSLGYLTGIGGNITVPAFHLNYPLVEQYSADIEHQLPAGILVKIGYVGAHGRNLADAININQIPDSVLAQYAPGGANYGVNLGAKVTNPYYATTVGGLPSTPFGVIAQKTVARGQTLLPFPQFGSITETESVGHSQYNALDIKVQQHFRHGFTALVAYTWSSNWDNLWGSPVAGLNTLNPNPSTAGPQDDYNPNAEFSRATNDIPNRFSAALNYDLPVGRGKPLLGNASKFLNGVVGGWHLNEVTILENGGALPIVQTNLSTSSTYGTTGVAGANQRPNLVPGVNPCYSGAPEGRLAGTSGTKPYFNTSAFTLAPQYTYGNAPRTLPCKGPGFENSDLSINKTFSLIEGTSFEFRAEALNAFNTPEFAQPNITIPTASSTSTGAITGGLGFARILQIGGRLTF